MDGRSMESRVARLERECRRWRLAGVAALVGVVGVGAAQRPPDVVRARRLEIVDDRGRPRVTIEAADDLCGLRVEDPDGRDGITLGTYDDGTRVVNLWDRAGKLVALGLTAGETGPGLGLSGPDGRRIFAAVTKAGPAVTMKDAGGYRIDAGVGVLGPIATMKGAKGEVLFRAPPPAGK
jgi:hypothetical protein